MAEKEKKKPVTTGDAFGELAGMIIILLVIGFLLGRLSTFVNEVSARFHAALGDLPVGETPIGSTVGVGEETDVFDSDGNLIGTIPGGSTGTVVAGPVFRDGERLWYVDFLPLGSSTDEAPDGWVKESSLFGENGLPFVPGDTPVGTDIETKEAVGVYETPGGRRIGTREAGSGGTVVGGPQVAGGKRYWLVDFDPPGEGGGDGWVLEEGLQNADGSDFKPGGTPVGRDVATRKDADVFSDFNKDPESQKEGAIGVITKGPFVTGGIRYWYVDFDEGPDGWVAEDELTPAPSFNPGKTPVGSRVQTSPGGDVSVHQTPAGAIIGRIGSRVEGVVTAGPTFKDNERWWYVDFDEGSDGWVRESALQKEAGGAFSSGETPIGFPMITGVNTVLRDSPAGKIVGGQPAAAHGMVSDGPVSKDGVRYWYVDFNPAGSGGPDGWVSEEDMRSPDGSAFNPGDTPVGSSVQSKRKASIYDDAGEKIGTQKTNREGVVERGPIWRDGERYWYVDFEGGPDGWIAERDISSYVPPGLWKRLLTFGMKVAVVLLWITAGIFLLMITVVVIRTNGVAAELNASVTPVKVEDVLVPQKNRTWERVMQLSESDNPAEWKLAIIEADTMLDRMLSGMGYHGETVGERLKSIERSDFTSLDDAWEAHKVRNRIAHEGGDFLITGRETRRVILMYKRVFEEFRLI